MGAKDRFPATACGYKSRFGGDDVRYSQVCLKTYRVKSRSYDVRRFNELKTQGAKFRCFFHAVNNSQRRDLHDD